jgi:hypothetical protein
VEELNRKEHSVDECYRGLGGSEDYLRERSEISVSIVTYETDREELSHLLDNLAASNHPVDVTVIDNSPSDKLRTTVTSRQACYLHSGCNLGFGGGHNLAFSRTLDKCKYHIVINPDISLRERVVGDLFNFMEDHPNVGLVMPAIRNADGTDQGLCKRLPTPADLIVRRFLGRRGKVLFRGQWERYDLRTVDLTEACEVPCLSGCFMFMRSAVLRQVGVFDERFFMYMEDVDLCRRIGHLSKCAYYPFVAVTHGYAKGSYRDFKLLRRHALSATLYFLKWGWFIDAERKQLNQRAGTAVECLRKGRAIR